MNELSEELSDCRIGCILGNITVNHYMYADDLVVFSPSSAGFQHLLNICSDYGIRYDVQYNTKKNVPMICRTKEYRDLNFPRFLFIRARFKCMHFCKIFRSCH